MTFILAIIARWSVSEMVRYVIISSALRNLSHILNE